MLRMLKKLRAEQGFEPGVEYHSYMPMNIPKDEDRRVKLMMALNNNIVLLQDFGQCFNRGKLHYDPNEPRVIQFEYRIPPVKAKVSLDDIKGLMKEVY